MKQWVEDAASELGGIDGMVCNVSALAVGNTPETWEKSFRTDMMHTVNSIAAAQPYLEKSSSASIVIVSSVSGFEVDFAAGSYGAFKAALIYYAKGLSSQLIATGIRVNAVSPGNTYFEGGIWQNIERGMPDLFKTAMALNPTGAWARRRKWPPASSSWRARWQLHFRHQPHHRRRPDQGGVASGRPRFRSQLAGERGTGAHSRSCHGSFNA